MLKRGTAVQQVASRTDTGSLINLHHFTASQVISNKTLTNNPSASVRQQRPLAFNHFLADISIRYMFNSTRRKMRMNSTHILDALFKPEGETQQIYQPEANGLSNMLLSLEILPSVRLDLTYD